MIRLSTSTLVALAALLLACDPTGISTPTLELLTVSRTTATVAPDGTGPDVAMSVKNLSEDEIWIAVCEIPELYVVNIPWGIDAQDGHGAWGMWFESGMVGCTPTDPSRFEALAPGEEKEIIEVPVPGEPGSYRFRMTIRTGPGQFVTAVSPTITVTAAAE